VGEGGNTKQTKQKYTTASAYQRKMDEGLEITSELLRDNVPSPSLRINSESDILHEVYDNIST